MEEALTDLVIRPFRPPDQVAVKTLILAGLEEHWGTLDPTKNPDLDNIAATYDTDMFLVVQLGAEVVGTGALIHEEAGTARIVRMSVASHLRRQGIGRAILQQLYKIAQAKGYRRLVLETTETWQDAIAFYKQNGFQVVDQYGGDIHFSRAVADKDESRQAHNP